MKRHLSESMKHVQVMYDNTRPASELTVIRAGLNTVAVDVDASYEWSWAELQMSTRLSVSTIQKHDTVPMGLDRDPVTVVLPNTELMRMLMGPQREVPRRQELMHSACLQPVDRYTNTMTGI